MAAFKTLDDAELAGKRVLCRVDLNVPMTAGAVSDDTRIRAVAPTIAEIADKGGRVILLAHFGRPKGQPNPDMSLEPVVAAVTEVLGRPVGFTPATIGETAKAAVDAMKDGEIVLLENTRFHAGEEKNDPELVAAIAELGDLYVDDAFSASHRAHASTEGLAHRLPAYAGRAMQKEIESLESALAHPERPVVAVIGGAKVSSKIDVLENLTGKVDALVIGGGMANTFLLAKGVLIGRSLAEPDLVETARRIMAAADKAGCEIVLPVDAVVAVGLEPGIDSQVVDIDAVPDDQMILDIGPKSIATVESWINRARTLVWNGPLGAFEVPPFDAATVAVARHAADRTQTAGLNSVAGGGETVAALHHAGAAERFGSISTAGGAFLEWLEGKALPGVEVLRRDR
ncbi:phosphoglycerate kinase [Bauldia sp.]|uniref:phosphoglycerate kinase n=1 Tax=Bauldia sp. TaxID=2575872 RepID=UPI003BA84A9B